MSYTVEFLNEKVKEEFLALPDSIVAKLTWIMELIELHGISSVGHPYTKPMEGYKGLFEIRAKAKVGIGRSLYCYAKGKNIIILHSFVKKTQKTAQKDIDVALERKKEIDNGKS